VALWFKANTWNPGPPACICGGCEVSSESGLYFDGINLGIHPYYGGNNNCCLESMNSAMIAGVGLHVRNASSGTMVPCRRNLGPDGVKIYIDASSRNNPFTGLRPHTPPWD